MEQHANSLKTFFGTARLALGMIGLLAITTTVQAQQNQEQQQQSVFTLERGHVQMIQIVLNDFGYHPGTIDGLWSEQTSRAVQSYQLDEGADATGQLNATQTCYLLRVSIATHGSTTKFPEFCRGI